MPTQTIIEHATEHGSGQKSPVGADVVLLEQSDATPAYATIDAISFYVNSDITDVANAQLSEMAAGTVKANIGVSSATPSDVVIATDFKTELGLGTLADQNQVEIADINATGTPGSGNFLRGDGQWATVVTGPTYQTIDIDDGTTLTSAHAKLTISSGALTVTKLRLRHSTNQASAVTVTMPDDDTITVAGAEFDIIVADDQTGTCTIQRETNGTINGATSVALAGARSTAVLIVDTNSADTPVARLEGETNEARTVAGATTFSSAVDLAAGFDPGTGASAELDMNEQMVYGNLAKVETDTGTLDLAQSGEIIVTSGNITIPTTAGFNCTLVAGGAHTVSFNSTTSAAMAAGDIMSIVVQSATVIHAVLTASADKVAFS